MTNKPMLSVERDLIERAVQAIINTSQMQPALNELRAILDKEVDGNSHAPKQQGEPVAWVVFDNGFIDDHTVVKTVADEWEYRGLEVTPLYAEQPAPASVVMPEPYGIAMFKMLSGFDSVTPEQFNLVWTACRKEVARLNGVKP